MHANACEQCDSLNSTPAAISEAVARAPFYTVDDRDEAVHLPNHFTLAIQSWKCHFLRSAQIAWISTDQACLDVIDTLDQESVSILNDWAMKYSEVPRVAGRLVWQAWYIMAHISRIPTGRRGCTVARVHPR